MSSEGRLTTRWSRLPLAKVGCPLLTSILPIPVLPQTEGDRLEAVFGLKGHRIGLPRRVTVKLSPA